MVNFHILARVERSRVTCGSRHSRDQMTSSDEIHASLVNSEYEVILSSCDTIGIKQEVVNIKT